MKVLFRYLIFCLCLGSCIPSPKGTIDERLAIYLGQYSLSVQEYEVIFMLTENGNRAANEAFALFLEDYIFLKRSLCVIATPGRQLDISSFAEEEHLIFDFESYFMELGITWESCAIFLKKSKVDTIVKIQSPRYKQTLAYLSEKLEEVD